MTTNHIKRVLAVGGAGYIGGAVTDSLLAKKIPFTVYDDLTYENRYLKPVDFIYGDIRDRAKLKKVLPNYSSVIWLAAIVGDGACAINPQFSKEVNQDSVAWLSRNYNGRIVFSSTCSVYGINAKPVTEEASLSPLSVYAKTKLEAETYLRRKNAIIFRLGTAYGISDTYSRIRMDLAVNYMTMHALKDGTISLYGGEQWRPFIHVKDIGEIIVGNLDSSSCGIFNVATQNMSIFEMAKIIQKETGCRMTTVASQSEDRRSYCADITKALKEKVLKLRTKRDIHFGVNEMKDLFRSQRIKDLESDLYWNHKYLAAILSRQ